MIREAPTRVASLTPPGTAAIATLALCGSDAWDISRRLFRPLSRKQSSLPARPVAGSCWIGKFGADLSDDVVLAVKRLEPLPWIEIHCHGGKEVVRMLLDLLVSHGAQSRSWQQFLAESYADPLQAAAAVALANSPTIRTATILLDQFHGAFRRSAESILHELAQGELETARPMLERLASLVPSGKHLTSPWRVVLGGAPNVGKSSLMNALAGYPRCIISQTPGTTRDLVTASLAFEGWPVELTDTAGIREGSEELEALGVARARSAIAQADLCLWVLDASTPPVWPESRPAHLRWVINKIDLGRAWDQNLAAGAIGVSALTSEGLDSLCASIARWLVPTPPEPGEGMPFTRRLCEGVVEACGALSSGDPNRARSTLASLLSSRDEEISVP